jgi:hypothetical protein
VSPLDGLSEAKPIDRWSRDGFRKGSTHPTSFSLGRAIFVRHAARDKRFAFRAIERLIGGAEFGRHPLFLRGDGEGGSGEWQ